MSGIAETASGRTSTSTARAHQPRRSSEVWTAGREGAVRVKYLRGSRENNTVKQAEWLLVDVLLCHLSTDLILIIFDGSCTLMLLLSAVLFPLRVERHSAVCQVCSAGESGGGRGGRGEGRAPRPSTVNPPSLDAQPQPPACIASFYYYCPLSVTCPTTSSDNHLITASKRPTARHPALPGFLFIPPTRWVMGGGAAGFTTLYDYFFL